MMPTLTARTSRHLRLVTPNASFAERDANDNNSLDSLPDYSFPTFGAASGSSPRQHSPRSPSLKRASVGLPSQYPGHHRNSSLAETVMEELQDFEELFEQSCYSTSAMDEISYTGDRLPRVDLTSSMRDDLFDVEDDLSSVVPPSEEEEKMPPPPPRRKGHHRRARNQAMDQDFFERVMSEIHL